VCRLGQLLTAIDEFVIESRIPKVLKQKARAAYAGLAIGDALGATVEFMTPREIAYQYDIHRDIIGGGWLKLEKGSVTDDTEMSLALGRSILETGRVDAVSAAKAFDAWMRAKPKDIGNTVRRGIMHFRNTGDAVSPRNDMDAGNGSCMRTLPVALCMLGAERESIVEASRAQAHITHNAKLADAGTECVIDLVQLGITGASRAQLRQRADELVTLFSEFRFDNSEIENPSGYIVDTLKAVFAAFFTTSRFESCLVNVVNKGGDADTTGAIAGMIAGAFYGRENIPEIWRDTIDEAIMRECMEQADALVELSASFGA
jgi:ADP-ribosyl-[dinitrogen reductase] hydrolase